jgi:hypothetical protein
LITNLISRASVFSAAPVANGIYGAVEKLLSMSGSIADGVIRLAPSCADGVRSNVARLQNAYQNGLYEFNVAD